VVTLRSLLPPSSGSRQSRKSQLYQGWPVGRASGAALFEAIQAQQITIFFPKFVAFNSSSSNHKRVLSVSYEEGRSLSAPCAWKLPGCYLMFKLARAAGVHPYLVSWEEVFCALPSVSSLPLTDSSFCYTAVSAAPLLVVTHKAVSRIATKNSAVYLRRFLVSSLRNFEVDLCWVTRLQRTATEV